MARLSMVLVLLVAGVATADEPPERTQAKRLKELGTAALEAGRPAEALEHFREAFRVFPSANMRFNLGLALERLGRDLEALEEYERFLVEAAAPPAEAREFAETRRAELEKRVAHLTVDARPSGAEITVDEKPVGRTPLARPLRLLPGSHVVTASHASARPRTTQVAVAAGETHRLTLTLESLPGPAAPERTPLVRRWWLWTLVGVGAAVVVTAIAVGVTVGAADRVPTTPLGTVMVKF